MTAIASALSHAATPFNETFYATVAVIIPVLYLALVVQGGGVDALLREGLGDLKLIYASIPKVRRMPMVRMGQPGSAALKLVATAAEVAGVAVAMVVVGAVAVALTIVACLIAVAGGVSELCALYALYKQDTVLTIAWNTLGFGSKPGSVDLSYIVLAGTGILILAAAVLPFFQVLVRVLRVGKTEPAAKPPVEDNPERGEVG